jgi:hypothetical protein
MTTFPKRCFRKNAIFAAAACQRSSACVYIRS